MHDNAVCSTTLLDNRGLTITRTTAASQEANTSINRRTLQQLGEYIFNSVSARTWFTYCSSASISSPNLQSSAGSEEQSPKSLGIQVSHHHNQPACRPWKRGGRCARGDNCRFSHNAPPEFVLAKVGREAQEAERDLQIKEQQETERKAEENNQREAEEARRIAVEALLAAAADRARQAAEEKAREEAEQRARGVAEEARRAAAERTRRAAEEKARQEAEQKARQVAEEARRAAAAERARQAAEEKARQEAKRKARQAAEEILRLEREAAFTEQHQVLGSSLITVGSGLDIRHVVSGFESCRLTIRNLPLDAKEHEIIELFTQQGINRDSIRVDKIVIKDGHREAVVLTNRAQGGPVAIGLDGSQFRDETIHFEFGENTASEAMGQSSSKDCNVLTITWRAPSITMIATYHTMDLARSRARVLDNTLFAGRKLKVEMNRPPNGVVLRHYIPESIKIMNLPPDILSNDVAKLTDTSRIKPLKPVAYNLEELLVALRHHLDRIGGLQTFEQSQQNDGNIAVKARFEIPEQAQSARDSLDGVRLRPGYPLFHLFLPKPHHYIITISTEQYHAQKRNWDSLAEGGGKGSLVRIQEQSRNKTVFIRVVGDEKKAVGALKVRVETSAAGERLDAKYWHRSFSFPKGREFLSKVYADTGVFLRCDWKIQALRMYGDDGRKERARQMITNEVARLAFMEWTIPVKREAVGYLVRKGLVVLKERLGDDAVTLDLASRPCKLTLRGGEDARHALDVVFEQAMNGTDILGPGSNEDDVCPVCYEEVSHPVKLGCNHIYCTPCIRHYVTSAADTKVFPLTCMGDEAKCKVPIPIPVIRRFLLPQQYKNLVDVVFSTYLDQHPQDFRYCTTPDCTQIYRCNLEGMIKCPSCFAEVCPSCHEEAHEGMTCGERNRRKTQEEEALNNNWATMNGVKKCPSCQVWLEKTEGCNHMTCRCGAHICWNCMGVFPANEIYRHLGEVHGGAFDGDGQRQNEDLRLAARLQRQYELRQDQERAIPRLENGLQARRMEMPGQPQAAAEQERAARAERERHLVMEARARFERAATAERERMARERARQDEERAARERLLRDQQVRLRDLERQRASRRREQDGGWGCIVM